MPTDIEGEPLWHDTIVGPANDDDIDAESVCDALVLLQDNARWLDTRTEPISFVGEIVIGDISDTAEHDYNPVDGGPTFNVEAWHPSAYVHLAAQLAPVEIAGVYTLQFVLYQTGSPVAAGPITTLDGASLGCASPFIGFFTGLDAGTYEVRVRVRDVSGAGHTSKGYALIISGYRMGGHAT